MSRDPDFVIKISGSEKIFKAIAKMAIKGLLPKTVRIVAGTKK